MAFQDFKYQVVDILGYVEYQKTDENYDHFNHISIHKDDEGHIIRIETQLTFLKGSIYYISKGELDYFVPKMDEDYFDLRYIVAELIYQSYCRQAGYIFSAYSEIPRLLPTVFELYNLFDTDYTKNHF